MRDGSDSRLFRSRIAQLIALGGVITTAACTDATAPKQIVVPKAAALSAGQSGWSWCSQSPICIPGGSEGSSS